MRGFRARVFWVWAGGGIGEPQPETLNPWRVAFTGCGVRGEIELGPPWNLGGFRVYRVFVVRA